MRRTRTLGLALATLGGVASGACNLFLGLDRNPPGAGGGSASSGGMNGGGDAAGDGDAEPDGGSGRGIWSKGFSGTKITGIAAGQDGTVYLTGSAGGPTSFGCTNSDAGTGSGYVVQLDASGNCLWGFFFGEPALGTGVAVDTKGNVALTALFNGGNVNLIGNWPPPPQAMQTNSFVALFDSNHMLTWSYLLGDNGMQGNQITTAVAINDDQTVVVSAVYTSSIGVIFPPGAGGPLSVEMTSDGTDSVVLRFGTTGPLAMPLWISSTGATAQLANAVALDSGGNVVVAGTTTGNTLFNGQSFAALSTPSIFLASWNSMGDLPFAAVLAGDEPQDGTAVAFDTVGNMLVGGTFTGTVAGDAGVALGGTSVLIARYLAPGTSPLGSIQFGSDTVGDNATLAGIAPYSGTSITFAGGFQGTAHFPSGESVTNAAGFSAVYVAKVDGTLGKVLWLERYGDGMYNQAADAVAVDPNDGSILVAGHFQGTLDFGGSTTPLMNTTGTDQLFVAKLTP